MAKFKFDVTVNFLSVEIEAPTSIEAHRLIGSSEWAWSPTHGGTHDGVEVSNCCLATSEPAQEDI